MNIQNLNNIEVDRRKIENYLLSLDHFTGKSKAKYFFQFGFSIENIDEMIDSLKRHFFDNNIAYTEINAFGIKYIIEGKIETPDKRNPMIRSVWIIENYDEIIKFVTAYPI